MKEKGRIPEEYILCYKTTETQNLAKLFFKKKRQIKMT